ncbi:hypothetical protein L3X38_042798 [Prunus dulcis]|uniref:Uncharacterized protein n=1 Tax=Prunus dulcis TaxID=3755 RepID=A0AAD4UXM2_PRUDU|nr:hypothetical protein L3X38_042798 [Prunus dulcis]
MPKCSYNFKSDSVLTMAPQVASVKIKLKPFTNKENFMFWQRMMKYILNQEGLSVLVGKKKKLVTMMDAEWEDLDELAKRSIK